MHLQDLCFYRDSARIDAIEPMLVFLVEGSMA